MSSYTSPTKITISKATTDDIAELGHLLHSVKIGLTINRLVWDPWPNTDKQISIYTNSVKGGIETPGQDNWKAVDTESGEIVGFVTGIVKKAARTTEEKGAKEGGEPRVDDEVEAEAEEERSKSPWQPEVLEEIMGICDGLEAEQNAQDHYDIIFLCTASTHRRCGVARSLMNPVFEKAQNEGLHISLVSEPMAVPFWKSLGFEQTGYGEFDLSKYAEPNSGFGKFGMTSFTWRP